ncbi:hypothetical protein MES4922_140003 [Mesorhizobium ventifaucium]|uniref:Uncharacterized protein n=1 Tax=Mesorhizobium ventifaucium TaxID=666020 RepID=A0ABN8JFE1_9HYPH|nr:hypothetical protein MES4922_140003 [Mesorhizobium ventifaucium]
MGIERSVWVRWQRTADSGGCVAVVCVEASLTAPVRGYQQAIRYRWRNPAFENRSRSSCLKCADRI